jgi:single-strand DNA-binding protein
MYNYVMLIGRLCQDVEVQETSNRKCFSRITLAIQRPFKNGETNEYDTDFIPITVFDALCDIAQAHLHKGDLIGVKGRLDSNNVELKSGAKLNALNIIAERIMFISQKEKND